MTSDSIDDVLGEDHARLGALLADLRLAIRSGSPEAGPIFRRFDGLLRRHMAWEEEALFPAARARATAGQRRSIESLEIDHDRLRETLDRLGAALPGRAAGELLDWLETLLKGHNYDEERGVYVEADRLLEPAERRRLIAAFESSPPGPHA